MSWRTVVISQNAKLDYQIGYLVVRGQDTRKIHLNEIRTLIVENTAVSLTSYLLSELMKHKIKVVFCDEKRNPSSELLPYYGCHDTSQKIRRQMEWSKEDKACIWTEIVSEKIKKQAQLLEKLHFQEVALLNEYLQEMEFGDATNREGHAAKVYFNALFGKKFTRNEESPLNAALNYGYSLLLSSFNREIVSNGYITQIGLFHDNQFNQFNLASDFMEPYRPIVDELVYQMKPDQFETDEKHALLKIFEREVWIDGKKELLVNAMKLYTKSIFDALNEQNRFLIKFYQNEL